jgi:hypothetical protein
MIGRILVKVPKIRLRVLTSYGCITEAADAHRDDGKRFIVRADEKLTAFIELESAIRASRCGLKTSSDVADRKPLRSMKS